MCFLHDFPQLQKKRQNFPQPNWMHQEADLSVIYVIYFFDSYAKF